MLNTLRRPLALLASAVAAATCLIATAAPASAATATTCTQPSVSGAVQRDTSYPYNPWMSTTRLLITATGSTTASCAPSRYSTARYRYEITLDSSATEPVVLASSGVTTSSGGSTISFPSGSFTAPTGAGEMQLTIRSYSFNAHFNYYQLADTRTFDIDVPASYDTANLTATNPNSCDDNQVKPMGYTKWGGCEV